MPPRQSGSTRLDVAALHRTRLEQINAELVQLAHAATGLSGQITEILEKGGVVNVSKFSAFFTGTHARLLKDFGVIEQLQSAGVRQRSGPVKR